MEKRREFVSNVTSRWTRFECDTATGLTRLIRSNSDRNARNSIRDSRRGRGRGTVGRVGERISARARHAIVFRRDRVKTAR